jgi:hypothetical protein
MCIQKQKLFTLFVFTHYTHTVHVYAYTCMAVLIPQITQRPLSAASLETCMFSKYWQVPVRNERYNVCQPDPT